MDKIYYRKYSDIQLKFNLDLSTYFRRNSKSYLFRIKRMKSHVYADNRDFYRSIF